MENFWNKFKKPFYCLAPLAGITDSPFRELCRKFGADVVFSEMISATAVNYGDGKTLALMEFKEEERPIVIQLFGNDAAHFSKATQYICRELKPDGIDINFGCPVPKVIKQNAGIALFGDIYASNRVIEAVCSSSDIPVSIKVRSRVGKLELIDWLKQVDTSGAAALTIHGRSPKQGFSGPVDTDTIREARSFFKGRIIANGGVIDKASAEELLDKSQADGLAIGQGALGRPWVFKSVRTGQDVKRSPRAVKKVALEHSELMFKAKGNSGIIEMRKHLAWYIKGIPGAKTARRTLVRVESLSDIRRALAGIDNSE